jgi:2'-5' RNA ligase
MKRIFIAADISDEVRRAAAAHIENIRRRYRNVRVSWVRPENLHVTVKFLGDVDERRLEAVKAAVSRSVEGIGPFQAALSTPEAFGKRVLDDWDRRRLRKPMRDSIAL